MLDKIANKYIKQGVWLCAGLFLLTLLAAQVTSHPDWVLPAAVSAVFNLVCGVVYGLVWKKVAARSPKSLPTLYMAGSAMRLFLALVTVLPFFYVWKASAKGLAFTVIFILFYLIMLAFDTWFFVSVERNKQKR